MLHVRHGRWLWVGMLGPLLIGPARQPGKAFLLEEDANVSGAEGVPLVPEQTLNVVDGKVLLARLDDTVADGIGFGGLLRALGWRQEKRPGRVLAKVVGQNAETALGVAETTGGFFGGEFIDEESAEGFVLAVGGVSGLQENFRQIC